MPRPTEDQLATALMATAETLRFLIQEQKEEGHQVTLSTLRAYKEAMTLLKQYHNQED